MDLNEIFADIQAQIKTEAGPRANGLILLQESARRRAELIQKLDEIQAVISTQREAVLSLPFLPSAAVVRHARAVLMMVTVAFMEIDTTGVDNNDQTTRFTLVNRFGEIIEDVFVKTDARLSRQASHISGVTQEMLDAQGVSPATAWPRIQAALSGYYVISFAQKWDLDQLAKMSNRYSLEPLSIIGECLQKIAARYYNEQYPSLSGCLERVGYALPQQPQQTAIDRAQGQVKLLEAIASAMSDRRELALDDMLGDLDGHPF
jgi:hypothetical protein